MTLKKNMKEMYEIVFLRKILIFNFFNNYTYI